MPPTSLRSDPAARIASLEGMELERLRAEWLQLYRSAPPDRLSRDLIIRGIAHRLQEVAHGGLSAPTRRRLATLAKDGRFGGAGDTDAPASLRPGATLVRTWRGETHTVLILAQGYEHRGSRYRSLSQIASVITGARWSGPRFFGLTAASRAGGSNVA